MGRMSDFTLGSRPAREAVTEAILGGKITYEEANDLHSMFPSGPKSSPAYIKAVHKNAKLSKEQ